MPIPRGYHAVHGGTAAPTAHAMGSPVKAQAAELDDTAVWYERSRRLAAQEKKIAWRPEDADDYQPQMVATSYLGQEWNSYCEPGYEEWRGEWREE